MDERSSKMVHIVIKKIGYKKEYFVTDIRGSNQLILLRIKNGRADMSIISPIKANAVYLIIFSNPARSMRDQNMALGEK